MSLVLPVLLVFSLLLCSVAVATVAGSRRSEGKDTGPGSFEGENELKVGLLRSAWEWVFGKACPSGMGLFKGACVSFMGETTLSCCPSLGWPSWLWTAAFGKPPVTYILYV